MTARKEKRLVLIGVFIAMLTVLWACAQQPPLAQLTQACSAYTSTLNVLSAARTQGRLSAEQIARVDEANTVALTLCAAQTPPIGSGDIVEQLNAQLEALIFESGVRTNG